MSDHDTTSPRIALALGGLSGSNAFGAGVLEAAFDLGVRPAMISATSGQIGWVHAYLARAAGGRSLRAVLHEVIAQVERTGLRDVDATVLALAGLRGAFRPAWFELPVDLLENMATIWQRLSSTSRPHPSVIEALARLAPARLLVPEFPAEFFAGLAQAFVAADVPILFNSFSPGTGTQHVHLNPAARALLEQSRGRAGAYAPGTASGHRDGTVYQDVTAEAVRAGLWLYEYGFEDGDEYVDGAYYRQMMLTELWPATDIVAVRPLANAWAGEMPRSFVGVQDLKTQVYFDGAYAAERAQIQLVNTLVEAGELPADRYHHIDFHEIQLAQRRGVLDYVFEDEEVFDLGYARARDVLSRLLAI
ncbi:MAG: hypothetical protein M9891_17675 [Austwickia sp.]|nr:hypothetical protein [Actinomycetota bacterium]MCB1254250.1 hypothetical protein [Austwickia sp.]MCO5311079.1 hypothetical protein [Austwickia sp.]